MIFRIALLIGAICLGCNQKKEPVVQKFTLTKGELFIEELITLHANPEDTLIYWKLAVVTGKFNFKIKHGLAIGAQIRRHITDWNIACDVAYQVVTKNKTEILFIPENLSSFKSFQGELGRKRVERNILFVFDRDSLDLVNNELNEKREIDYVIKAFKQELAGSSGSRIYYRSTVSDASQVYVYESVF